MCSNSRPSADNAPSPGCGAGCCRIGAASAKTKAKAKTEADTGASALKAVGVEACKRHGLAQVWVTSDGQSFPQEGDAKEHAKNLASKQPLK